MRRIARGVLVVVLAAFAAAARAQDAQTDARAREVVAEVSRDVAALRGLAFARAVPVARLTPELMRRTMLSKLDADWPEPRMRADERALKLMGLLPADYDLRRELVGLYTAQAAGMYDETTGRMLVASDDLSKGFAKIILSHELTHALQDQHFNLSRLIASGPGTFDHDFAILGVVEGDATLVMSQYVLKRGVDLADLLEGVPVPGMGAANRKLLAAPPLVRRMLLGPYVEGMAFVSHFRAGDGWKRVDAIYADMPLSAEQVLHPKKYYPQRDFPQRIDLVRVPAFGAYLRTGDVTLGESGVRAMVETWAATRDDAAMRDRAVKVAAGWDGDRLLLYETPDRRHAVLYWISTWDTTADAVEMQTALWAWLTGKYGRRGSVTLRMQPELGGDVVCVVTTGGPRADALVNEAPVYRRTVVRRADELRPRDACP